MSRDEKFVVSLQDKFVGLSERVNKFETWEPDYPLGGRFQWDDLRISITATKLAGAKDPGFTVFKTNGAGSQGVFLYWFDAAAEEELYFTVQLPHAYMEGTDLHPHVHFVPSVNGAAGQVVSWGLEYTWANLGDVFGNTNIIYANAHTPTDSVLTAGKHYLTEFAPIVGSGKTISSMLACRVFRNATGAGGSTDSYGNDAGMLEIDFHMQKDSIGSYDEYTKA